MLLPTLGSLSQNDSQRTRGCDKGVLKAKILEANYEAKLEFLVGGGEGGAKQKPSMGGIKILYGTTLLGTLILSSYSSYLHIRNSVLVFMNC